MNIFSKWFSTKILGYRYWEDYRPSIKEEAHFCLDDIVAEQKKKETSDQSHEDMVAQFSKKIEVFEEKIAPIKAVYPQPYYVPWGHGAKCLCPICHRELKPNEVYTKEIDGHHLLSIFECECDYEYAEKTSVIWD